MRRGRDYLSSGREELPNSDVVDGGEGDDGLGIVGTVTDAASVDGSEGRDSIGLGLAAGENALTNALAGDTGELRHGAVPEVKWTDLESFYIAEPDAGTHSVTISAVPRASPSPSAARVARSPTSEPAISALQVLPAGSSRGPGE